jgi:hypothetical protein
LVSTPLPFCPPECTSTHPRGSIFVAGFRSAVAQALIVLSLALLRSSLSLEETTGEVLAAMVSGLLTAILVLIVLPAVEVLFGYTTAIKLNDLSNLNHPLLRQLLVEAPGTYYHSIMVGTLAEAAAGAVGANRLLARTGGYYHDIGKVKNPRAYDENGQAGFATLSPVDEAKEIKMHVTDGLEIGARHRLGQSVLEIIAQHHGTSRVRASRRRGMSVSGGSDADFAHAGPRPTDPEAAIVMLADVVEVGTRELVAEVAVDRPRIEAAVRRLVQEVASEGQLDHCDLTLKDLGVVIREFTDVLDERVARRTRSTLSAIPTISAAAVVRPPPGGEPN